MTESTQTELGETIADGLFAVAKSLDGVAKAIIRLGNADAATPMGGMEALGDIIAKSIATGLNDIAMAIEDAAEEKTTDHGH